MRKVIPAGALVLAALLASPASFAQREPQKIEPKAWDQAEVTAAAARLVPAVQALHEDVIARSGEVNTWGRDRYWTFRNDLRVLQHQSHTLQASLEAGQGMDETKPIWFRIRKLVREARDALTKGAVPVDLEPKLERARKEVLLLAAYYGQTTF
ncbi:MAG: hypothetical protein QNK04_07475 [Myxococcota bacterium]|nr:hypothetical protein [Myxococcota bacterium]